MNYWKKLSAHQRQVRIEEALTEVIDFANDISLGYPASRLDTKVFNDEVPFLKDAPILQAFVANPNNIGCHTLGTSERAFRGTQQLEREVLEVFAEDIFKAEKDSFDGYVATGGTEANIQALWMYRNFFQKKHNAKIEEIVIITSEDTHYSIPKGSNMLTVDWVRIPVIFETRSIDKEALHQMVKEQKSRGKKYFIVVANMGTTMFGSVDNIDTYTDILEQEGLMYKLHIDAAYGGFVFPFSNTSNTINFANPKVSSITIDAHKMLRAPYGTGIFICRKGLIDNVLTKEAAYVEGMDLTMCGSRSGANVVAVWSILFAYGYYGWKENIDVLQMRTAWLCQELDQLGVGYFREPFMNIVTIKSEFVSEQLAHKYHLVPQEHDNADNKWYKIIVMEHVEIDDLLPFLNELKYELKK